MKFAPIALFALLASACDTAWTLQGHAVRGGTLQAAANAQVTLRCPDGAVSNTVADDQGNFELGATGHGPSLDCELSIRAPGARTWSARIDELCADSGDDDHCDAASAAAVLEADAR